MCAHCGRVVLLRAMADDQLWNLAIQCHGCGGLNALPDLPPGRALPRPVVMIPKGRYLIKATADPKGVVMAGEEAVSQHQREAGSDGASLAATGERPPTQLQPDLLAQWIQQLRDLLGSTFDKLLASDRRATSSPTPPPRRHGLMVVVEAIDDALKSMASPNPTLDFRVLEAHQLLELLKRWSAHPLWPQFVESLEAEYHHTIGALTIATFLQDAGNSVEFQASSGSRTPDLMLVLGSRSRCAVEIKVPQALINPPAPLTKEAATKLVTGAFRKAGTGSRGQLARRNSAFLAIAGFNLESIDVAVLEDAAKEYLGQAARRSRHQHVMGILIFSFNPLVDQTLPTAGTVLSNTMAARIVRHPGYRGSHKVSAESRRPLRRIRGLE